MFRKSDARNRLRQMGGIMSSSPELMQTVQKFQVGGPVNTQQRINQANRSATIPGANYIQDFVNMANAQSGIANMPTTPQGAFRSPKVEGPTGGQVLMGQVGDYLGDVFGPETPEEVQQRVAGARSVGETFGVPENAPIRNVVPDFLKPQEGPARGIFTDMTLEEKAAAVGLGPEVGRRITDPEEIARLQNTPEGRGQSPSGMPRPGADTPTLRGPAAKDLTELSDRLPSAEAVEGGTPEDQAAAGKIIQEEVAGMLASEEVDEETKNDVILTMLDKKQPGEKLSKSEQIKKNREAYREIFGTTPERDKEIDGYNLAMMGFLIASGDSPNALQNIARGAASGLKNFQKTAEKRQNREDKLTELAVREYENTLKSEKADEQFRMNYNLKVQQLQDRRDQAATQAERDRFNAVLKAVDDPASALALVQLDKSDVDLGTEDGLQQFNNLRTSILARQPDLLKSTTDYEAMPRREEFVLEGVNTALDPDKGYEVRARIAAQNNLKPEQVSEAMITNYYGSMYDNVVSGRASGAGAAPAQISTREEYDALPSGASYIDPQGNRGVKR